MPKKRLSSEQKLRREVEVLKAQIKTGTEVFVKEVSQLAPKAIYTTAPERHNLPIKEIKKDLIKTFLYTIFAFGLLFVLHLSKFDLVKIASITTLFQPK